MVLKKAHILPFLLLFFSCQTDSETHKEISQQTPSEQGASLYTMHCAQCHGEDGKLGSSGAKDLSASKLSDAKMLHIIKNGKGAMPPMKALLETNTNIQLVLGHIKALRR
jgi:cytochrome c6